EEPGANNIGEPLPCTYDEVCEEPGANNIGEPLPCTYDEECSLRPIYRMISYVDDDAPEWYWGTGSRNGSCWVIMHDDSPQASKERQMEVCSVCVHPDFIYEADRVIYDGWVYIDCKGNIVYGDSLWDTSWFRADHDDICHEPSCINK
ncbi:hypothetical protein ACFL1M_03340, partial [Patescibacteria group bacterium]